LLPSSGALQTVTAATGVCHELGWNKSCIDVKVGCALYYSMAELGLILSQLMTNTSGCCYSL